MKKSKKMCSFGLVLALVFCLLTGCMGSDMGIQIKEDGTGSFTLCYMVDKGVYEYLKAQGSDSTEDIDLKSLGFEESVKMHNGTSYIAFSKTVDFASTNELEQLLTDGDVLSKKFIGEEPDGEAAGTELLSYVNVKNNLFEGVVHIPLQDEEDTLGMNTDTVFSIFNIAFEKEITYTNGKLSEDKKTAIFEVTGKDQGDIYMVATTADKESIPADTVKPVITGVANGKTYKKFPKVTIKENVGCKVLTANGKPIDNEFPVEKDGTYKIVAQDFAGNTSKVTFKVDTTAPKVQGVGNHKSYRSAKTIKFTDKNGIKSATLNGKKIKSGKKVSKPGKYTLKVTDKAGNITKVYFSILKSKKKA